MVTQYPIDLTKIEKLLEKVSSPKDKEVSKIKRPFWEAPLFQGTIFLAAFTAIIWFVIFLWDRHNTPPSNPNTAAGSSVVASTAALVSKIHISYKGYKLSDFSTTTIYTLISKVRKENDLRSLLPLESDKPLKEQSSGTISIMSASYLDVTPPFEDYENILRWKTQKNGSYNYQFEVHKLSDSEINLMGFISEESFVELNQSQASTTSINFFPFSYKEFNTNYLVLVPINTIVSSEQRDIPVGDSSWTQTAMLSLVLRNWKEK